MAAAVSIARYLLDEASSGSSPTTCADDEGGHDLTIDYGVGDAEWSSNADGNGLDFLGTSGAAGAVIDDMSDAGSIGGQLDGAAEASIILVARPDSDSSSFHRGLYLGKSSGNGDIAITFGSGKLQMRWNDDDGGGSSEYSYSSNGSEDVFHFVWDSNAATAAGRGRFWLNGVEQTAKYLSTTIGSGDTLATQSSTISLCLGNRPDLTRQNDLAIWYCELFTGQLTTTEISDSYDALILDHDANWDVGSSGPTEYLDPVMMGGML